MIYYDQFIQSIASLNEFVCPRAVLCYQKDLVESGCFSLVCPWTGEAIRPTSCHIYNIGDPAHGNIGIAYRMVCVQPIWLLASSVKDGFPIAEAYLPAQHSSLWRLNDAICRENQHWREALSQLEIAAGDSVFAGTKSQGTYLLLGHPNFAHHLWNELPALYAYSRANTTAMQALHIKATYEPLVPLEQLAGDAPLSVERINCFDELVGLQDTMVTRLGATQIPVELRENIRQLLCVGRDRALTDPLVDELRGSHPVIWLSVRLDARTPDNQDEFLISLVSRVSRDYPEAAFILDGFSYPDDFGSAIYQQEATDGVLPPIPDGTGDAGGYLSSAMMSREEDISAYVCKLQASLNSLLPNTVVNTSGMRLANAVYLAHLATYYVCHAGTLQHKIAWIYNIRGIVHSNTAGLQPGVRNWLADQLQDGVKPSLISGQYVTDLDSIRTINQVERNRDYHLQDIEKIVDQIMIDMKDSIGSNCLSVNQST